VLRRVLGTLLVTLGAVTVVLAVAASVWVHLNLYAGQFDVRSMLLVGAGVALVGGAVVAAGLFVLTRKG
jgi:hypothetical protein